MGDTISGTVDKIDSNTKWVWARSSFSLDAVFSLCPSLPQLLLCSRWARNNRLVVRRIWTKTCSICAQLSKHKGLLHSRRQNSQSDISEALCFGEDCCRCCSLCSQSLKKIIKIKSLSPGCMSFGVSPGRRS